MKNQNNKQNLEISDNLAEFFGWHLGDGCLTSSKNKFQYSLTGDIVEEKEFYIKEIIPIMNSLFGTQLKSPIKLKEYSSIGVCGIYISGEKFAQYLKDILGIRFGKKLQIVIPELKIHNQKKCFLRGIFDTDGSIYFCKSYNKRKRKSIHNTFHYRPKMKLATISNALIEEVNDILLDLGFHSRIQKPIKQRKNEYAMHSVIIDSRTDILKWIKDIGFRNPKHYTKVKIWKKFGFCPPYTTLYERTKILNRRLNPAMFYQEFKDLSLEHIEDTLSTHII